MMGNDGLIIRNQNLLASMVDTELVLLNTDRGEFYGLDAIGADIWERLSTPQTRASLVTALVDAYDGAADEIERDLSALLEDMRQHGMIMFDGEAGCASGNA